MSKKVLSLLLVAALLVSLTVTASAFNFNFGGGTSTGKVPTKVELPQTFRISYSYKEDHRYRELTLARDASGSFYYKTEDEELLFVKNGSAYQVATNTLSGFVYLNNNKYDLDYVKQRTEQFWKFADQTDEFFFMTVEDQGEGEMCGRKVDKVSYSLGFSMSFGGYDLSESVSDLFAFDQETGICLYKAEGSSVSFATLINDKDDDVEFECTEFVVSGVELPKVN